MSVPRIQDAAALLEQGNPAAAIPLLERLTTLFPTYVTAHVLLAEAYEAEGMADRATRAWHAAYFLLPQSPVVTQERQRILGFPTPPRKTPPRPAPAPAVAPDEEIETYPTYDPDAFLEDLDEETEWADTLEETEEAASPPAVPYWQPLGDPEEEEEEEDETALEEEDETEAWATFAPDEDVPPPPPPPPASDHFAPVRLGRTPSPPPPPSPPQRKPPSRPAMSENDLDDLIHRLENAGRIVPKQDFRPADAGEQEQEEEVEDMVSETLARIYEAQQQYAEAARTYERLARQHPEKQQEYLHRAATLRGREGGH